MARKIKVDNAVKKRIERAELKRRERTRSIRVYFLIICEGEKTEPLYFQKLKAELPKGALEVTDIDIVGTGRNTLSLIEEAQRVRAKKEKLNHKVFDQVWAVFDKDDFPNYQFNTAIEKAENAKEPIQCAWSNEAFELWYLLHFEYLQSGVGRATYLKKVQEHIRKKSGNSNFAYRKNDEAFYALLQRYGNEAQAMRYAEKLESIYHDNNYATHKPSTRVHKLVKVLRALAEG